MESGKTRWTIDISDRDSDAAVARINAELADIFARRGDTQAVYVTFDFEFSAYFYNVAKMTLLPHRGLGLEDKAGKPVGSSTSTRGPKASPLIFSSRKK